MTLNVPRQLKANTALQFCTTSHPCSQRPKSAKHRPHVNSSQTCSSNPAPPSFLWSSVRRCKAAAHRLHCSGETAALFSQSCQRKYFAVTPYSLLSVHSHQLPYARDSLWIFCFQQNAYIFYSHNLSPIILCSFHLDFLFVLMYLQDFTHLNYGTLLLFLVIFCSQPVCLLLWKILNLCLICTKNVRNKLQHLHNINHLLERLFSQNGFTRSTQMLL